MSRRRSTGSSEWKDWLKPRPYRAGDLSHDVSSVWYCDDREEPEDEVWSRNHVSNTPVIINRNISNPVKNVIKLSVENFKPTSP